MMNVRLVLVVMMCSMRCVPHARFENLGCCCWHLMFAGCLLLNGSLLLSRGLLGNGSLLVNYLYLGRPVLYTEQETNNRKLLAAGFMT